VLAGLAASRKYLPCKYFYDQTGSELFEKITALPEYYPTRTERAIMETHAAEMAALLGRRCLLVEYGSGSSTKTRLLLDQLCEAAGYVPIDVSCEHLSRSAEALATDYPGLQVLPLCADFTGSLQLPIPRLRPARRVVYFPGSTIGNFPPDESVLLLRRTAELCGAGGGLLLGADVRKDPNILEAAYNDSQGITAAFNCNLLARINRELGADFVLDQFDHHAFYNAAEGRIEMHLVSRCEQSVHLGSATFHFKLGESIHTENSYKYSLDEVRHLAEGGGFKPVRVWTDEAEFFSVHYLAVRQPES
jgi:dimethylhistidine N-methyltransferase